MYQFPRLLRLAVLVFLSMSVTPPVLAEESPEKTVQVSVKVNTWYDDSAESLKEVRSFVDFFPPEPAKVVAHEDLNHFVIRQFGFGARQLPSTYALVLNRLFQLNELKRDDLPIGRSTILAPPLPKRAVLFPNTDNPYNAFPQTSSYIAMVHPDVNGVERSDIDTAFRRGSRSMVVSFRLPREYVAQRRLAEIFKSSDFRVTSEPLRLNMQPAACGAAPAAPTFPDQKTMDGVHTLLSKARKRNAYLFLLDSGWPDAPSYSDAVDLFETTLRGLRAESGLAPFRRVKPKQFNALNPKRSSVHALKVAESLQDLRALDTQGRVRVVFVPLALDQGDDDFFQNLLETYFAFTWTRSLDAQTPAGQALERPVLQDSAAKYATGVIEHMRLLMPPGDFYTDNAVLEAVYMVGDAIGEAENTHYFVNQSWTIDGGALKFALPSRPRGITVVASGNDDNDFVAKAVDFAQQSLTSDRFIAVMNISPAGKVQCHSSIGDENRIADLRLLGFDGNIVNDSGTSFASPRVAWLLALKETVTALVNPSYWATDVIKNVKASRAIHQPKWSNVWFDVPGYYAR